MIFYTDSTETYGTMERAIVRIESVQGTANPPRLSFELGFYRGPSQKTPYRTTTVQVNQFLDLPMANIEESVLGDHLGQFVINYFLPGATIEADPVEVVEVTGEE